MKLKTTFKHRLGFRHSTAKGFSLIELLVVIGIVGLMATLGIVALRPAQLKARDAKRFHDLGQIGRYLTRGTCYIPTAGAGDYDLSDLVEEIKQQYPQLGDFQLPVDPKSGSLAESHYRYQVLDQERCIVYGNLENENETITLPALTAPTAGAGSGVLQAAEPGPNQTVIFYQVSS